MKKCRTFFSGVLAAVLAISLAVPCFAAAGKVSFNQVGLFIQGTEKVKPGSEYTINQENLPSIITYESISGQECHYIPVQMLSDFLGVPFIWREEQNSIILGISSEPDEYDPNNFWHGKVGDIIENPETPVLGETVGPFTEVSPSVVNMDAYPVGVVEDHTRVQGHTGFSVNHNFDSEVGKHIVLTVTNNGSNVVYCNAGQSVLLTCGKFLPTVNIAPGKTLTRAFEIAEGTPIELAGFLADFFSAVAGECDIDITVSLSCYK